MASKNKMNKNDMRFSQEKVKWDVTGKGRSNSMPMTIKSCRCQILSQTGKEKACLPKGNQTF